MRPGQLKPNDLELEILQRLASAEASIRERVEQLHVLSREFTGVGSFTTFKCDDAAGASERRVGLDALINVPGVPHGMGAVLLCRGDQPECLELYTYGDHWDGVYEGFSIEGAA